MKYLFTAKRIFEELLNTNPQPTGSYQWFKVMKGDILNFQQVEDFEKYDVVHINMTQYDQPYVQDIRTKLKNSSTKIVLNQDHVPQTWDKAFMHPLTMRQAFELGDYVFATTPQAQSMLQALMPKDRKVHMMPHPCETHILKKLKFTGYGKVNHMLIMYHVYDNPVFHPFFATYDQGITTALVNYFPENDPRTKATTAMYDHAYPSVAFPEWLRMLSECKLIYEPYTCHSFGRMSCESACLKVPCVGSDTVGSMQRLYPNTSGSIWDGMKMRSLISKVLTNVSFRDEIVEHAYDTVEYYNFKNSKERFMEMIES